AQRATFYQSNGFAHSGFGNDSAPRLLERLGGGTVGMTNGRGINRQTLQVCVPASLRKEKCMNVGDRVKWAQPVSLEESTERFTVIEFNGDRCFIQFVCDLPIPPVQLALVSDLLLESSKLGNDCGRHLGPDSGPVSCKPT